MPALTARVLVWPGLALGLAACAAAGSERSAAYQEGYTIGCLDGDSIAGRQLGMDIDEERATRDDGYGAGVRDGRQQCYQAYFDHPVLWGE